MQLSILIATNRPGLLACSRLAQACSWAGPEIEVVIRDNSGDAEKRAFLQRLKRDNCTIVIAEPCDILTNTTEILKLGRGEFIFILADDDAYFDRAIAALPDLIAKIGADKSFIGITGTYALELSAGSAAVDYKNLDADDPAARLTGFLSYSGPNVLQYAPVRRELVQRIFGFLKTQPFLFSFHDQINCLLYLLNGKFARLNRFIYLYDMGPWERSETAQVRDVAFYKEGGFDPAINVLHWFLCAFEGAALVRNAHIFPDYPLAQRQPMADLWFSSMFMRFKNHLRSTFDSRFSPDAERLRAHLLKATGQMSFHDMLNEITGLMAVCSQGNAQRYADFWTGVIGKRAPAPLPLAASG